MRLIHCHRELDLDSQKQLLALLNAENSCLVLREKAVFSCSQTKLINHLIEATTLYLLCSENSPALPDNLIQYKIDHKQFVELCVKAQQIIGWN